MTFDLGLDPEVEYHIIATEPVIENKNVMHHALLYGCADGLDSGKLFYDLLAAQ
jgi:dopamine beta-monooxygenase